MVGLKHDGEGESNIMILERQLELAFDPPPPPPVHNQCQDTIENSVRVVSFVLGQPRVLKMRILAAAASARPLHAQRAKFTGLADSVCSHNHDWPHHNENV